MTDKASTTEPRTIQQKRDAVIAAMPWYDDGDPDYTELDAAIAKIEAEATASVIQRVEGPFDADRMTHAWAILESATSPERWEPDRYNAAAFVRALLDKYEWLATATLADLAPKYVAALARDEGTEP